MSEKKVEAREKSFSEILKERRAALELMEQEVERQRVDIMMMFGTDSTIQQ